MAVRKAYFPVPEFPYFKEAPVAFRWVNGSRHQNSQVVLDAFHGIYPDTPALEVSLASRQPEGIAAAAMKLPLRLETLPQEVPVGIVYEASRVFENGGPYEELLQCSRQKVQKDHRLQQSGACTGYRLEGRDYLTEPYPYAFFNWLYGCALRQHPDRAGNILNFGAFLDLDLGSAKKDKNSPARAAAVYAGLSAAGKLDCLDSYAAFVAETCAGAAPETLEPEMTPVQTELAPEPELPVQEEPTPEAAQDQEPAPVPAEGAEETPPVQEPEKEPEPETVAADPAAPAEEPAQEDTPAPLPVVEGTEVPGLEQMQEICQAPKARNLMISLARNAGCVTTTATGAVRAGKALLLASYQKALEEQTVTINPEKNKITFPLENPDNKFRTVGLMTRSPTFVHGWKLNYQPCEQPLTEVPVEEPAPPVSAFPTAEEYLVRHGYSITRQVLAENLPPIAVQKLAWETGEALQDPIAVEFLQFIRRYLQTQDSCTFRMPKEASQESRELVAELAQSWDHLGLFSFCNATTNRITYTLASGNEVVRNFVEGHWLELYVRHCVQQLLERYQEEQGAAVSVCSNVVLSDSPEVLYAHELDVAFSVNGVFFWIEAKSSSRSIDYGKYADLCKKLQVTPDQLLLVNSDLSEDECNGVAYFWPYRIANCATMEQKLDEMIQKQLNL